MAVPRPPPMTHARRAPSSSVGLPSGPAKSSSASPAFSCARRIVVAPTAWNTMVTVPASGSHSFIVSGMRSPRSSMRSMMNWPGLILRAISGARTTMRVTSALSGSTRSMGYTASPSLFSDREAAPDDGGAAPHRSMAAIIATCPPSPCFEQVTERSAERKSPRWQGTYNRWRAQPAHAAPALRRRRRADCRVAVRRARCSRPHRRPSRRKQPWRRNTC